MAAGGKKKATVRATKPRRLSKKELVMKRSARINKLIQVKKKARAALKAKHTPYKKKLQEAAEHELVEAQEPVFQDSATNEQMNIMRLLNLAPSNAPETKTSAYMETLQQNLEKKLQELDQDSLENPQVRRVYTEIGQIFSQYRSGKIPKAFKIIPRLVKWKEVLEITRPSAWTPQAMSQATNIFASNFDAARAETFYSQVNPALMKYLIPAVREDLRKNKKLNFHYFESLRKAVYKTNAWFQAVVLYFCDNDATSREIQIVETLLKQMSIPPLNSAVAMLKMIEKTPNPAVIHFLKALIEKKYKLPKRVIDNLAGFFLKFEQSQEKLTVAWQQAFLSFCSQYSSSFDEMLKVGLKQVAEQHRHNMTPEILRFLA